MSWPAASGAAPPGDHGATAVAPLLRDQLHRHGAPRGRRPGLHAEAMGPGNGWGGGRGGATGGTPGWSMVDSHGGLPWMVVDDQSRLMMVLGHGGWW